MKIKDYECKCGHNDFFFANKGNQTGIYCSYCGKWLKWADKEERNLSMKKEPCEDAVSKASVFEILGNLMSIPYDLDRQITEKDVSESMDEIKNLPSVTLARKVGKWIKSNICWAKVCSVCQADMGLSNFKYCPNCGAKIIEPQESNYKCRTCKHYTSGERDGSCGSYICKEYSNWESEE